MRKLNKIGESTEHCGTPDTTFLKELFELFIWTHCFRHFK